MVSIYPLNFQTKKVKIPLPAPAMSFIRKADAFPEVLSRHLRTFHWPRLGHLPILALRESGNQVDGKEQQYYINYDSFSRAGKPLYPSAITVVLLHNKQSLKI